MWTRIAILRQSRVRAVAFLCLNRVLDYAGKVLAIHQTERKLHFERLLARRGNVLGARFTST